MAGIEPELWVDHTAAAVAFYVQAFDAVVMLQVGEGDNIVARLSVGDARFWVSAADAGMKRFSPPAVGGATGRTLLVVDDPDTVHAQAVAAGASSASAVEATHDWRVGRIIDPFGHEWEIGAPDPG